MKVDIVRRFGLGLVVVVDLFLFFMSLDVTFEAFGRAVDEAADVTAMLLLEVVNLFVLFVELLKLEGARALFASELKFTHCDDLVVCSN
jgi:hypothetical protein